MELRTSHNPSCGQGSVVDIAIMLRAERFGVEPHWGARDFLFCGVSSLHYDLYRRAFPGAKVGRGVTLTTHPPSTAK